MKIHTLVTAMIISIPVSFAQAENKAVNDLLQSYAAQGAITTDVEQGKQLWQKKFSERSCSACHTQDLTAAGKHVTTNKPIKPMATSVNPERLTDPKKVEKWFKRNCKWTLGRECTAQEKANFLVYIDNQN